MEESLGSDGPVGTEGTEGELPRHLLDELLDYFPGQAHSLTVADAATVVGEDVPGSLVVHLEADPLQDLQGGMVGREDLFVGEEAGEGGEHWVRS